MGGGLMQLVAYGAQDVYLTGNPQITFFKVVYRRHTNFSIEMDELPIDVARPGGTFTVQILRNGDLATRMYLRLTTPDLTGDMLTYYGNTETNNPNASVLNGKIAWVRRLGHAAIQYWKIQIGGTDIDIQGGIWLDLWYELTHTTMQERGYENMIGDVPEMTTLVGGVQGIADAAYGSSAEVVVASKTLYVPLQFWFNRNPGLALPLIALQYHDVRLQVELAPINKLIVWSGARAPNLSNVQYQSAGVMVDYIYLDSEERRRFAQVGHEYLIEQVQTMGNETLTGSGNQINQTWKLTFNHPCKELIWALKVGAFSGVGQTLSVGGRGTFLGYTSDPSQWSSVTDYAAANLAFNSFSCGRWDSATDTWVRDPTRSTAPLDWYIPEELAPADQDGPAVYPSVLNALQSFSLPGGDSVYASITYLNYTTHTIHRESSSGGSPLGYFNPNALLTDSSFNFMRALSRGALGGPNALITMTVNIRPDANGYGVGSVSPAIVVTGHNLQLRDISIPVEDCTDTRVLSSNTAKNPWDVSVIQPSNYGVRLDGAGNPVSSGNIRLNGHDRFDPREGSYFNYVQPYQHHTRTPADGVNVYSFGLHPEQHQPSGTANLSRIDTTELKLVFSDPFRANKNVPYLDYVTDSAFWIFGTNYNVLRCMSGMAGLAYSN